MKEAENGRVKITIGIADDSEAYRDALRYYFNGLKDVTVLFEAVDGVELIEELKIHQPHVVLLDLDMPKLDGMGALIQLRDVYPSVKFIMLTMFMEQAVISACIENGANSYLNKLASPDEIYAAIIKCCETDFYMNEWISQALISGVKGGNKK